MDYLPAGSAKRHGCVSARKAVENAVVPRSRMWGPQVRFRERGSRGSGGPYST